MRDQFVEALTIIGLLTVILFTIPGAMRLWAWWFCFLFPAENGCQ